MAKPKQQRQPMPPLSTWFPAVALGWLIPGGGHFLLKRKGRGTLLLVSITAMFLLGLMMRGALFEPQTGDLLTTLINVGGWFGNLCAGVLYLLARMFGYFQIDAPGPDFLIHTPPVHDYGTKFLVTAGLLNLLAIVDAFEIAVGRKD
jgi:TM2 domain-containing membrane protein YozV